MNPEDFKKRTKAFAVRVMKLAAALPDGKIADTISRQLLRCATSVGANCRAACRAKSDADFIAKMSIVEEEADKSLYWMELLIESKTMKSERLRDLLDEATQILAMTVASIKTVKERSRR